MADFAEAEKVLKSVPQDALFSSYAVSYFDQPERARGLMW
jgi:hypothetical protein